MQWCSRSQTTDLQTAFQITTSTMDLAKPSCAEGKEALTTCVPRSAATRVEQTGLAKHACENLRVAHTDPQAFGPLCGPGQTIAAGPCAVAPDASSPLVTSGLTLRSTWRDNAATCTTWGIRACCGKQTVTVGPCYPNSSKISTRHIRPGARLSRESRLADGVVVPVTAWATCRGFHQCTEKRLPSRPCL